MTPMPRLAARKPARVRPSSLHAWGVRGRPHAVLRRADTLAPCYRRVSPGTRTHPQELVPAAPRGGRGAETGSGSCAWILLFFLSFVFIYLFIYFFDEKGEHVATDVPGHSFVCWGVESSLRKWDKWGLFFVLVP